MIGLFPWPGNSNHLPDSHLAGDPKVQRWYKFTACWSCSSCEASSKVVHSLPPRQLNKDTQNCHMWKEGHFPNHHLPGCLHCRHASPEAYWMLSHDSKCEVAKRTSTHEEKPVDGLWMCGSWYPSQSKSAGLYAIYINTEWVILGLMYLDIMQLVLVGLIPIFLPFDWRGLFKEGWAGRWRSGIVGKLCRMTRSAVCLRCWNDTIGVRSDQRYSHHTGATSAGPEGHTTYLASFWSECSWFVQLFVKWVLILCY